MKNNTRIITFLNPVDGRFYIDSNDLLLFLQGNKDQENIKELKEKIQIAQDFLLKKHPNL